ncbi:MAG: bifunctional nuclease family protein [Acidimicrobiia bacterium]|nr:bifunctional nuclease family protein [Acidimicrobiia bacterium]MCL4293080.1 bifunctional nuclease family protein [Acidimicrobiia bacterium]
MIQVSLVGVRLEVPTNQPIVLLREQDGPRYLPIFIGPPEATAIVYALQGMDTPRPMTHDLLKTVLDDLTARLDRVEITELHDGTFYAEIELVRNGSSSRISSRPSDAIALAVRYSDTVPIFVDEEVLDEAGVLFDADDDDEKDERQIEQFREFLDQVAPEDFA